MKTPLQILLSLILLAPSWAEGPDASHTNTPAGDIRPPCCRKPLDPSQPTDQSLFQLESTWTSDVGRQIRLGVLRGRPLVVGMFFTRCEYACPILVNELKQLEKALPDGLRDQVDFLLVSFDSERDTPEDLATFRRTQQLGLEHWTLLRGAADDVRELAALLGINFQKDARGQFAHSNTLTVLNAEGEIVRQFTGLKLPREDVISLLQQQTPVAPTGTSPDSTSASAPSKRRPTP